ncbi:MAG: DNA-binding MarR family transcriptional regulator [Planctomycetota bacterium]|jgi:DNA-binding MarR family transcriptional regulator
MVRMADPSKRKTSKRKTNRVSKSKRAVVSKAQNEKAGADSRWTFLSNHAHVLICLAKDSEIRLREVAELIGITERAVQNILADLELEGLVTRHREGRRNSYELNLDRPLRHPLEGHRMVGDLVKLILN